MFDKLFIKLNK